MNKEKVTIYNSTANHAVIQTSGRKFPGSVIQGDTLNYYFRLSQSLVQSLKKEQSISEETLDTAYELHQQLFERLEFYQAVLESENLDLPYFQVLKQTDLVTLE